MPFTTPYTRRPYTPREYEVRQYDDRSVARLSDLIGRQGSVKADAERRRGEISARTMADIGQLTAQTIQQVGQIPEQRRRAESERLLLEERRGQIEDRRKQRAAADQKDRKDATAEGIMGLSLVDGPNGEKTYDRNLLTREFQVSGLADRLPGVLASLDALDKAHAEIAAAKRGSYGLLAKSIQDAGGNLSALKMALTLGVENETISFQDAEKFYESIGGDHATPDLIGRFTTALMSQAGMAGFTLNSGDVRFDASGTQIASVPKPEPVTPPVRPMSVPDGGRLVDPATGKVVYNAPPKAPTADNEPLVAVIGEDGTPVLVPRSQASGKRPASTREQGRAVTSGDAGRLADIDEALKLAGNLDFKQDDTGILPSIGGAMPDAVTNLTGFGLDAKKRQGVINLVKQIIGKGLEGGVLRKEDESKYAKILPTLSDPPEVVQAKIANLQRTMETKRSTLLDALTDAGYDTSKFSARGAPQPSPKTEKAGPKMGERRTVNGVTGLWDGKQWVRVK